MTYPSERKQRLLEALGANGVQEQYKFSAWCLYYFETEKDLIEFFERKLGKASVERVSSMSRRLWESTVDVQLLQGDLMFLEKLDWNVDAIDESDVDASQGLIDYLAAATFALKGVLAEDKECFYACSENVVNRMDYLMNFSEFEIDDDLVEIEYGKQIEFLSRVSLGCLEINWSR